jgi:hypothetical protein
MGFFQNFNQKKSSIHTTSSGTTTSLSLTMLRILFCLLSFSAFAGPRQPYPIWLYDDYLWQKEQQIHQQTMLQLQAQDQYRRQLLLQDQQRQLERLRDEQQNLQIKRHNSIMYEHAERLRMLKLPPPIKGDAGIGKAKRNNVRNGFGNPPLPGGSLHALRRGRKHR